MDLSSKMRLLSQCALLPLFMMNTVLWQGPMESWICTVVVLRLFLPLIKAYCHSSYTGHCFRSKHLAELGRSRPQSSQRASVWTASWDLLNAWREHPLFPSAGRKILVPRPRGSRPKFLAWTKGSSPLVHPQAITELKPEDDNALSYLT